MSFGGVATNCSASTTFPTCYNVVFHVRVRYSCIWDDGNLASFLILIRPILIVGRCSVTEVFCWSCSVFALVSSCLESFLRGLRRKKLNKGLWTQTFVGRLVEGTYGAVACFLGTALFAPRRPPGYMLRCLIPSTTSRTKFCPQRKVPSCGVVGPVGGTMGKLPIGC